MNIHDVLRPFLLYFRSRRMSKFVNTFHLTPKTTILDVGGDLFNWLLIDCPAQVTILNVKEPRGGISDLPPNFRFVLGDGTQLIYSDRSFDIVYSNSVIEHLYTYENQRRFACEAMRVGKYLWIQTPNKRFCVEPHLITPFVHWLPKIVQRRILRNCTIWGLITRPSQQYIDGFLDEVRLLSFDEMQEFFPGYEIQHEKFLFFTKAFVVLRTDPTPRTPEAITAG